MHTATFKSFTGKILTALVLLSLVLAALPPVQVSAATITDTFSSSGTWTAPAGVTSVTVEAWGGGGRGGSISGGYGEVVEGGGGGGAYSKKNTVSVTPGTGYTVTVGAGSSSTSAGGDSYFINTSTVLAKGGNSASSSSGASGGLSSSGVGDVKYSGGSGASGNSGSNYSGGGGSSAASGGSGVNATNATGATAPTGGGNGGNGRSSSSGSGTNGSAPGGGGGGAYRSGSFSSYSGGNGANGQVKITYTITTYSLTVTKAGNGAGTVTSDTGGINCGSTCSASYALNTVVTLTAAASTGSTFTGWGGDGLSCGSATTCAVTMSAAKNVTATFTLNTYALDVTVSGTGSGTVTSSPAGISCTSGTCSHNFDYNTPVTLTAVAGSGSIFTGWSGAGCSGNGTCNVTMDAAKAVTATFSPGYTLTVTKAGNGAGTVTSSSSPGGIPSDINCGSTCSAGFVGSTVVTLSASASTGSTFTGWTVSAGTCSGTTTPCTVTMDAAKSVTATFTLLTYALNVTMGGTGTGSVTSSPAGISCTSGTCSHSYDYNTTVTLTAAGTSGSTFTGWSGAVGGTCTGTTSPCTVTMTAVQNITASFTPASYLLTVTKLGTGGGTVLSSPSGINCGSTCSATYVSPTMVTLAAGPSVGSTFTGWGGDAACPGTGDCVVTMDAAKTVTATFTLNTYALNVTKAGTGLGTVTSNPAGISCPGTCSANFTQGSTVSLTATATAGSSFDGWTGAVGGTCSGTTSPCDVPMTAVQNITATFSVITNYTISGTADNGVTLTWFDVTTKTLVVSTGSYTITVPAGWSGTVTPSWADHYFTPENRSYDNLAAIQTGQNFSSHTVVAEDFYVDKTNGSCSDSGSGSQAIPFCTIGKSTDVAYAGDTVHVVAGSYAETVKPNTGILNHPVTYVASSTAVTVTGEAGNITNGGAFRLSEKAYVVIDGFTITNTAMYGIYVSSSDHITIQNNHVSYAGNPSHLATPPNNFVGIYLSKTTNSTVSGNTVDHNSLDGIRLINASTGNTVSNNISYANAAVVSRTAEGIDVETNSTGNTIIHNTTYANEDSGINFYTGSSNNFAIGNVSFGNGDHGIDNNASPNNTIIGNTIYGNVTAGINLEGDVVPGSGGATVMNNVAVNNGLRKLTNGGTSTGEPGNIRVDSQSAAGTTVDYNLYYLTEGSTQLIYNGVYYTAVVGSGGQEAHGSIGNPLLLTPSAIAQRPPSAPFTITIPDPNGTYDYHLTSGSPAIDSANFAAPSEPALDRDGNARVDDLSVPNTGGGTQTFDDRGAYEYQPATVVLSNLAQTYDGTPKTVTATTTPPGLTVSITYNGSATAPTDANSYAVVATITQPGYGGGAADTLVIAKATSTVTVTCSAGAPYTYTGSALTPCTAEATGPGITTPINVTASLAYTNNINAGAASANVTWAGDTNHTGNTGSDVFTIEKAASTVTVTCTVGAPYTYTGLAQTPCTAEATGAGITTPINVTASLVYLNNTDAGLATADASWAGDANHNGNTGSGEFTIGQASSTVTVTCTVGAPHTYTGSAQTPCTAEATGVGITTPVDVTASLVYANNTNVGSATADASWAGDDNHTGNTGSGGFTIVKADPACTITPYSLTYDGLSHTATGACLGAMGETLSGLVLSGTTHINAGDYTTDAWTYTDVTGNYNDANGTVHDHIAQFAATVTISSASLHQTYDGSPKPVTVTTDPNGLPLSITYNGSGTAPTDAGSYPVVATITDPNYTGSDSGTLIVLKADQTIAVTTHAPSSATNGTFFSVAATGGGSGNPIIYSALAGSGCTNTGSTFQVTSATITCVVQYDQDGNANYNPAARVSEFVNAIGTAPVITTNPASQLVNAGQIVSFTAAATGTPNPTVKWQVSTDGGTIWTDIPGATSSTLSFTAAIGNNGYRYWAIFTNTAGIATTTPATLTVNSVPVITEGATITVNMSQNGVPDAFDLTLHATDADGDTLTWSISTTALHGVATASGTGPSRLIGYTPNTDYKGTDRFEVQVSDGNGGIATILVNVNVASNTYELYLPLIFK